MPANAYSPADYDGGGSLGSQSTLGPAAAAFARATLRPPFNFTALFIGDSFCIVNPTKGSRTPHDLDSVFDWSGSEAGGLAGYQFTSRFNTNTEAVINTHVTTTVQPSTAQYLINTAGQNFATYADTTLYKGWQDGFFMVELGASPTLGTQNELIRQEYEMFASNGKWSDRLTKFDSGNSYAIRPLFYMPELLGNAHAGVWRLVDEATAGTGDSVTIGNYVQWRPGLNAFYRDPHADDRDITNRGTGTNALSRLRSVVGSNGSSSTVTATGAVRLNTRNADGNPVLSVRANSVTATTPDWIGWTGGLIFAYDDNDPSDRVLGGPILMHWAVTSGDLIDVDPDPADRDPALGTNKAFTVEMLRDALWEMTEDPARDRFVNILFAGESNVTEARMRRVMNTAWDAQHDTDGSTWTGQTGANHVNFIVPQGHIVTGRTEAQSHADLQNIRDLAVTIAQEMIAEGKSVGVISMYDQLGGIIFGTDNVADVSDTNKHISSASRALAGQYLTDNGLDSYDWGDGNTDDLTAIATVNGMLLDTGANGNLHINSDTAAGAFFAEYGLKAALATALGGGGRSRIDRSRLKR